MSGGLGEMGTRGEMGVGLVGIKKKSQQKLIMNLLNYPSPSYIYEIFAVTPNSILLASGRSYIYSSKFFANYKCSFDGFLYIIIFRIVLVP